jgi:hypothetical protein
VITRPSSRSSAATAVCTRARRVLGANETSSSRPRRTSRHCTIRRSTAYTARTTTRTAARSCYLVSVARKARRSRSRRVVWVSDPPLGYQRADRRDVRREPAHRFA